MRGEFKNGYRVGSWTQWHDNGEKSAEGEYQKGKKEGPWSLWDKEGNFKEARVYKNDVEVKSK